MSSWYRTHQARTRSRRWFVQLEKGRREVATHFLLREIELAMLGLHTHTRDLSGRTASRTQMCRRDQLGSVWCPFCPGRFFVRLAASSWISLSGSGDRSVEEARTLPLVGTCDDSLFRGQGSHVPRSQVSRLLVNGPRRCTP